MSIITIERKVLEKNDEIAQMNRSALKQHAVFSINLVSSPGSGKTSILEQTLGILRSRLRIGVIEGDVQTDFDAQRVAHYQVPVIQIVTNGGCHLEARLVQDAMAKWIFINWISWSLKMLGIWFAQRTMIWVKGSKSL